MTFDQPIPEAPIEDSPGGKVPAGKGWFKLNIADAPAMVTERFGAGVVFEPGLYSMFTEFGFNVRVLQPGQPNAMYHREESDEAFLLLAGKCTAIVEDREIALKKGDFIFAPAGTAHVFVGAGDKPCTILMVGSRDRTTPPLFPVSETAAKYGASVEEETEDRGVAYGDAWANLEMSSVGVPW